MHATVREHVRQQMRKSKTWLLDLQHGQLKCLQGMNFEALAREITFEHNGQAVTRRMIPSEFSDKVLLYDELRKRNLCPRCEWGEAELKKRKEK